MSKSRRYQEVDEEISFKLPGASKTLPSMEPMNHYVKPMQKEERDALRKKLAYSMDDGLSDASSTRSTTEHLELLYQQQAQLIVMLQTPRVSLPTLDEDPMKYFPFITVFENNIEKTLQDNSARLAQLVQLCTGNAARVIDCCTLMTRSKYTREQGSC